MDRLQSNIWLPEQAWEWHSRQGGLRGYNYLPRTAVNSTEMWQADTWDAAAIDQELEWAANAGYNSARVFLQYLVWDADPEAMKQRLDEFLMMASRHGQRAMFVLFDDCAFSGREPYLGPQDAPVPGVHNSGWTPSPGRSRVTDAESWPRLKEYVQDIVGSFGQDDRVIVWDLYNEPGNTDMGERSMPLVQASFAWAREMKPQQPLTTGVWTDFDSSMSRRIFKLCDIISFHCYLPPEGVTQTIHLCQAYRRPMLCTEWLLRQGGNTFEATLPIFAGERIGWYHWGLVAGKTQTYMPWGSKPGDPVPAVWQHDVFHPDGAPYRREEIELLRVHGFS